MVPSRAKYSSLSETDLESEGSEKGIMRGPIAIHSPVLACIFTILVVLQFIALYLLHLEITSPPGTNAQRLRSPIPEIPIEIKSFHRGDIYFNRSSPETDAAWKALAGPPRPHQGFINVPEYEAYGLQTGAAEDGKMIFGVSMFHQLHCLGHVREMLWNLAEGVVDGAELIGLTPNDTSSNFDGGPKHGFWHVQHCLDYLRQAIQCAGDTALEWPVVVDGKSLFVGWETPHQCRSYDAAWTFVDQHS